MVDAEWWDNLLENLQKQFEDVTSVEVITAVADEIAPIGDQDTTIKQLKNVKLAKMSYYARTTMELGGDTYILLPAGPESARVTEVTTLQQETSKLAVQNWNNLARTALTGAVVVAAMAKVPVPDKAMDLIEKIGFIPK